MTIAMIMPTTRRQFRTITAAGARVSREAHGFPIEPVQREVKEVLEHAMGSDPMKYWSRALADLAEQVPMN
jgi:hypothetical protein